MELITNRRGFIKGILAAGAMPVLGGCKLWAAGKGVSFVYLNDVHERLENFTTLLKFAGGPVNFGVLNGDILNGVGPEERVKKCLIDPRAAMSGALKAPVWFVRGNHETRGKDAPRLWKDLAMGEEKFYFAKTVGGVRFVVLDTGENRWEELLAKSGQPSQKKLFADQKAWLMKEVASGEWCAASARIVIMHIPPKCKRRHTDGTLVDYRPNSPEMLDMLTVLDTAKVSLACTAHLHAHHFDPASANHNYPIIMGGGRDSTGVPVSVPVITRVDIAAGGVIRIRQTDFFGKTVFERAPAV